VNHSALPIFNPTGLRRGPPCASKHDCSHPVGCPAGEGGGTIRIRVPSPLSRMSPKRGGLRSWVSHWEVLGPNARRAQVYAVASELRPSPGAVLWPIPEGFGIERARGRRDEPEHGLGNQGGHDGVHDTLLNFWSDPRIRGHVTCKTHGHRPLPSRSSACAIIKRMSRNGYRTPRI
jgi:hypothetical protein